jgi:hypothetical protein
MDRVFDEILEDEYQNSDQNSASMLSLNEDLSEKKYTLSTVEEAA